MTLGLHGASHGEDVPAEHRQDGPESGAVRIGDPSPLVERGHPNAHTNGSASGSTATAPARVLTAASATAAPPRRRGRIRSLRTFESARSRDFRWYFLSMLGFFGAMNMQMLVRGFLVFDLTGSYAALGTISLANAIPGLLLSLPGGVIADRVPKKVVQQVGSALNALNALSIALLLMAGMLRWEHLLINAVLQGIVQALMMPSRQSMLSDIVLPRQLMNAVALNNAGMNLARMIMPTLGGILLAVTHAYWVFLIMTGCYVFSFVTLIKVPSKPIDIPPEEQSFAGMGLNGATRASGGHAARRRSVTGAGDLWDGMRYIWRDPTVRVVLLVNFLMVLCSMPYMQMLPGFVKEVLGGGPGMQGTLMSLTSVGSLAAALVVASLPSRHRGRLLIYGAVVLGVSLTAFSFSNVFWVTAAVMVFLGVGQSVRMALSNVLVQSYVADEYRGRVMAIYMMEMNLVAVGTFGVALLAEAIGVQWALGLTSISLIALAVGTYVFSPRMRELQ